MAKGVVPRGGRHRTVCEAVGASVDGAYARRPAAIFLGLLMTKTMIQPYLPIA
jgi:hypothetical protein